MVSIEYGRFIASLGRWVNLLKMVGGKGIKSNGIATLVNLKM